MKHQYKRRKIDEAKEIAQAEFKKRAKQKLSEVSIREIRDGQAVKTTGSPCSDWESVTGFVPKIQDYYQVTLCRPSNACPWVDKIYVRILVPRNRNDNQVYFQWEPAVPEYDGPYFE